MPAETAPEISVVMPVLQSAATLERALRSLLGQTFPCWELLAVDGGSTDDSYDRMCRAAAADSRIRPVRQTPGGGPAAARNQGLSQARGQVVTYLDCADELYPDYLDQVKAWQNGADVLVFAHDPPDEALAEGAPLGMHIWSLAGAPGELPWEGMAAPLGLAHRRDLLDGVDLANEALGNAGDGALWRGFAAAGVRFLFVPQKCGRCGSRSFRRSTPWSIGLYAGPSPLDLAPHAGVSNPVLTAADVTDLRAAFVADPFLAFAQDRWYMFFEIMPHGSETGVIGLAESRDGLHWEYRQVVLREPFHLSYPHVFAWQGDYYMTPETLAAGCVRLYRAVHFPERWQHIADLVAGQHADPTVFRAGDAWWLFTCPDPASNRSLRLFQATCLTGPWTEHPQSPVVASDARVARPAGRVIAWDKGWLRFTQDCRERYGLQIWAFRITTLTGTDYAEELARPTPLLSPAAGRWNGRGMHHVDAHPVSGGEWLAVVDGYR